MDFQQTALMYLLIGLGLTVGIAGKGRRNAGILLATCLFWPLFLPFLVGGSESSVHETPDILVEFAEAERALDRISSMTNIGPAIQERVVAIKAAWLQQCEWLVEADRILNENRQFPQDESNRGPAANELRIRRDQTAQALRSDVLRVYELAVAIQLWKAPGANREDLNSLLLAQLAPLGMGTTDSAGLAERR